MVIPLLAFQTLANPSSYALSVSVWSLEIDGQPWTVATDARCLLAAHGTVAGAVQADEKTAGKLRTVMTKLTPTRPVTLAALQRHVGKHAGPGLCPACIGKPETPCKGCGGKKLQDCSECWGSKTVECPHCEQDMDCTDCEGTGKVDCKRCSGYGIDVCDDCQGRGQTEPPKRYGRIFGKPFDLNVVAKGLQWVDGDARLAIEGDARTGSHMMTIAGPDWLVIAMGYTESATTQASGDYQEASEVATA